MCLSCAYQITGHGLSFAVNSEVKYAKDKKKENKEEEEKESSKILSHQLPLITDFLCHPACQG